MRLLHEFGIFYITLAGTLSSIGKEKRCMFGLCCANSLMLFCGKKGKSLPQDRRIKNKGQSLAWVGDSDARDASMMFTGVFPRVLLEFVVLEDTLEGS